MRIDKAKELARIAAEIFRCRTCRKGKIGQAVPGEGDPDASVVFIGEAPGRREAAAGRPFIGPSGKLLRALIKAAGLEEKGVFITSPVKYLPEYVTPKKEDIEHGWKHLAEQLAIIKPEIIVLLGSVAVQAVLGEKVAISKKHGKIIERGGIRHLICYHPAASLHNPNVRGEIEKDFKKLKRLLA